MPVSQATDLSPTQSSEARQIADIVDAQPPWVRSYLLDMVMRVTAAQVTHVTEEAPARLPQQAADDAAVLQFPTG